MLFNTVNIVIDHQIEILADLQDMFQQVGQQNIARDFYGDPDIVKFPLLPNGTNTQLHYIVTSLGKTIDERKRFSQELSGFTKKLEKARDAV
jgi:hypothetical protein